jgi:hypothetical protein
MAVCATPGNGFPSCSKKRGIADDEGLGVAGNGKIGFDDHPAGAIVCRIERRRQRRRCDACGPRAPFQPQAVRPPATITPWALTPVTAVRSRTSIPSSRSDDLAASRSGSGNDCEDGGAGLDQHDPCAGGIDGAEFVAQRSARDLGQRAGQFDACRPATDEDERQQFLLALRIPLALGTLERQQDATPDSERVLERS